MDVPTIVIVPAACQTPALYAPLALALQSHNITSHVIPTPSVNASPALRDFTEDVVAIQKVVGNLIENGTDVILLMHSYGGVPGTQALKGLGKAERQSQGKVGGVVRLIYVASYALRTGEAIPGMDDKAVLKANVGDGYDEEKGILSVNNEYITTGLLHDVPTAEVEHWAPQMGTHSVGALASKLTYTAWNDIPSAYVICTLDRIVPPEMQEEMIANAKAVQPRAFDLVTRLESGHEPILSKTEELAGFVREVAAKGLVW